MILSFKLFYRVTLQKDQHKRTLEGSVAAVSTRPQNDKYETIPVPVKINTPTHHAMDFENLKRTFTLRILKYVITSTISLNALL